MSQTFAPGAVITGAVVFDNSISQQSSIVGASSISVLPSGINTGIPNYCAGWKFSALVPITITAITSMTSTWGGGGSTRRYRFWNETGTVVYIDQNISNTDPVVNSQYTHTLASPLSIPAGIYVVSIDRANGPDVLKPNGIFHPLTPIISDAYYTVAGVFNFPYSSPTAPAGARDGFFIFNATTTVFSAIAGALTATSNINLQPNAVGTKYIVSSANPSADRTYAMPDMGVDGSISVAEESAHVSSYVDNTGVTTYITNYSHQISRRNNQVTITWPANSTAFSGASTQVKMQTAIPARYRPISGAQQFTALVTASSVNQVGRVEVGTDGIVTWYRDPVQTAWAGTANDALFATSVTYNII